VSNPIINDNTVCQLRLNRILIITTAHPSTVRQARKLHQKGKSASCTFHPEGHKPSANILPKAWSINPLFLKIIISLLLFKIQACSSIAMAIACLAGLVLRVCMVIPFVH
jgi:hypothetical protein